MRTFIRKLEVRIRYFFWALSRIKNPTNYDRVSHSTGNYIVKYGNPNWIFLASHHGKKQFKKSEFKVLRSFSRDLRVFKEKYGFQMGYWYSIDYSNKIGSGISYVRN